MGLTGARGEHLSAFILAASLMSVSAQAQIANTAPPPSEDDRLKLFQSVFGGKKSGDAMAPLQTLSVPLFMDGNAVAHIQAKIASGGTGFRIELGSLIAALAPLIEERLIARLKARADPEGFLGLDDLKGEGLSGRFDLQNLVFFLDLPPRLRGVQDVDIGPGAPTIGSHGVVPTAGFSSYANLRGSLDYVHAAGSPIPALQANLALDGAVNLRGLVLEGSLTYFDSAQRHFQRGDLRLVRDDPVRALRYSAGDLAYATAGFQSFVPMAGFAVARNYALQPYFIAQPTGTQEFLLEQESQVEVFVNGIQDRILTLPAGRYNFRNLPFTEGLNDVELRATDRVGRVTTIAAPFFFSSHLLAPGVEEFSYSVGQPSSIGSNGHSYELGLPAFSAFHRIGLSGNLTVGGNFQGSIRQQQLGGEFAVASGFGTIHMDLAASHEKGAGFGSAVRLFYNLLDFGAQSSSSSLLAQATYVGPNFSTLGAEKQRNHTALDLGMRYTRRILTDVYASVGASYQVGRDGEKNGHDLSLSLQHSFAGGLMGNLRMDQSVDRAGRPSVSARFALTWQLGDGHGSIQSTYDTASETAQASYRYSPSNFIGEPGGTLNIATRRDEEQVTGSLFYNTSRVETALSQDAIFPSSKSEQEPVQRTSLRAGTSLVFADGHFGVGRPIGDSFGIVVPTQNYADQEIILDSSGIGGRYEARTDFLGPAVLPSLSAYQIRPLSVTIPDLPVGYQLSQDQFQLLPNYRSGTVVMVGNDATVVLDGTLVDRTGTPLALLAGEIVALDRKDAIIGQFFTNRSGRFRIEGVGPGTFELRLERYPGVNAHVTISPGTKGVYVVGEIKLAMEAGSEAAK